ncbi:hypothetical protein [Halopiger goleimassiliensis]|uniref:hypothetical protein n=1 Tax=Halopiger goleimassiliensis TaxID=1293048 RepID=UPI0006775F49|nr:hypothetical protein [Halopiger goleimassiliensis]
MASDTILPRTAIEWYMFGALLVVANMVVLLATNHTLPQAFGMGVVFGLLMALAVAFATAAWTSYTSDPDSIE